MTLCSDFCSKCTRALTLRERVKGDVLTLLRESV